MTLNKNRGFVITPLFFILFFTLFSLNAFADTNQFDETPENNITLSVSFGDQAFNGLENRTTYRYGECLSKNSKAYCDSASLTVNYFGDKYSWSVHRRASADFQYQPLVKLTVCPAIEGEGVIESTCHYSDLTPNYDIKDEVTLGGVEFIERTVHISINDIDFSESELWYLAVGEAGKQLFYGEQLQSSEVFNLTYASFYFLIDDGGTMNITDNSNIFNDNFSIDTNTFQNETLNISLYVDYGVYTDLQNLYWELYLNDVSTGVSNTSTDGFPNINLTIENVEIGDNLKLEALVSGKVPGSARSYNLPKQVFEYTRVSNVSQLPSEFYVTGTEEINYSEIYCAETGTESTGYGDTLGAAIFTNLTQFALQSDGTYNDINLLEVVQLNLESAHCYRSDGSGSITGFAPNIIFSCASGHIGTIINCPLPNEGGVSDTSVLIYGNLPLPDNTWCNIDSDWIVQVENAQSCPSPNRFLLTDRSDTFCSEQAGSNLSQQNITFQIRNNLSYTLYEDPNIENQYIFNMIENSGITELYQFVNVSGGVWVLMESPQYGEIGEFTGAIYSGEFAVSFNSTDTSNNVDDSCGLDIIDIGSREIGTQYTFNIFDGETGERINVSRYKAGKLISSRYPDTRFYTSSVTFNYPLGVKDTVRFELYNLNSSVSKVSRDIQIDSNGVDTTINVNMFDIVDPRQGKQIIFEVIDNSGDTVVNADVEINYCFEVNSSCSLQKTKHDKTNYLGIAKFVLSSDFVNYTISREFFETFEGEAFIPDSNNFIFVTLETTGARNTTTGKLERWESVENYFTDYGINKQMLGIVFIIVVMLFVSDYTAHSTSSGFITAISGVLTAVILIGKVLPAITALYIIIIISAGLAYIMRDKLIQTVRDQGG